MTTYQFKFHGMKSELEGFRYLRMEGYVGAIDVGKVQGREQPQAFGFKLYSGPYCRKYTCL